MKPTVIGAPKSGQPVKPTAIPKTEIRVEVKPIHPTAITPTNVVGTPVKTLGSPTAIKGVVKESPEQKSLRLQKALPDIPIDLISRVLMTYDIDYPIDIDTVGISLQEKYWKLVNKFTTTIENPAITNSSRHVQRMLDIFQEIVSAPEESGVFFKTDTIWDLYEKRKAEIRQLYDILKSMLPMVRALHVDLMELNSVYRDIGVGMKAATVLLLYLEQKEGCDPNAIQLRKLSLMETIAAIQNGSTIRDSAAASIATLIEKITGTILTKVPEWIEHVTLTLRVSKTKTDVYQFRTELDCIMSKLK